MVFIFDYSFRIKSLTKSKWKMEVIEFKPESLFSDSLLNLGSMVAFQLVQVRNLPR